ncbi:MAG: polymer-forming cytoskeletal protein [Hyphomicrobium sp.]|nr:polymer-forming cytoskeletal protein [Hyphomicrobium sp.]
MFSPKKPETTLGAIPSSAALPFAVEPAAGDVSCSIINEWLTMRGDLESEGDILIKGKVHGNIQCKLLVIDTSAIVEGAIFADDVVIRGSTRGIIKAERVRLEKTANIDSEIYQTIFSAEEGARIKGSLRSTEDYVEHAPPAAKQAHLEKQVGASLYHLLDQARSAQHAHLAVPQ